MCNLAKELSDMYIRNKNRFYTNLSEDLMKLTADNQSSKVWQTGFKLLIENR